MSYLGYDAHNDHLLIWIVYANEGLAKGMPFLVGRATLPLQGM